LLADGHEISLKFLIPYAIRFSVRQAMGRLSGLFWDRLTEASASGLPGQGRWVERGAGLAVVAAGQVLEIGLALTDLGVKAGDPIAFFVSVFDEAVEAERHPAYRPIELTAPDALFEARNWRA
jgi:hypothetical protein